MRVFLPMVLSASLMSFGVAAQQEMPPQEMPGPLAPQPEAPAPAYAAAALAPQRQGDISFISGGASADDRAALQGVAGNYNMRLMFAVQPSGDYLADVAVTLVDARGKTVLDTVANGPLFYALVPPGDYHVIVASQGQAQTRPIDIAARGAASRSFYWRQTD